MSGLLFWNEKKKKKTNPAVLPCFRTCMSQPEIEIFKPRAEARADRHSAPRAAGKLAVAGMTLPRSRVLLRAALSLRLLLLSARVQVRRFPPCSGLSERRLAGGNAGTTLPSRCQSVSVLLGDTSWTRLCSGPLKLTGVCWEDSPDAVLAFLK